MESYFHILSVYSGPTLWQEDGPPNEDLQCSVEGEHSIHRHNGIDRGATDVSRPSEFDNTNIGPAPPQKTESSEKVIRGAVSL